MEAAQVTREWFTVEEIRTMLGISKSKTYELLASGELPSIKVGRVLRVKSQDFEAWQERSRHVAS